MKKIAVLFGGCSSEYEVSLQSAYSVITNIDRTKYTPVLIGINRKGNWFLFEGKEDTIVNDTWHQQKECYEAAISMDKSLHGIIVWKKGREGKAEEIAISAALPMLHGKNGEDGTVQGALELAGIPVIGCNTVSSAVCMDKDMAHRLAKEAGVSVPKSILFSKDDQEKAEKLIGEIGYPVFVKPLRAGSSFGITKVDKKEDLKEAMELAFSHDELVVAEEMIEGFEVGCAILGKEELIVGEVDEIQLSQGFFDYTEKYTLKSSKIFVPARISEEKAEEIKNTGKKIYKALGCSFFARVDMFLTPRGEIYFNEVNTIPGFTEHSRYPGMMKAAGLSLKEVVNRLIEMAV